MSSENEEFIKEQNGYKKRVSIVWKYFEKLNRYRVRCKLCSHEQNYQGTTGNILRHLKNKHNIDATLKGQSENPEISQVADIVTVQTTADTTEKLTGGEDEDEFDVIVKTEHNEVNILTIPRQQRQSRSKVTSYAEEPDIDPYSEVHQVELAEYFEPQVNDETKTSTDKYTAPVKASSKQIDIVEPRHREKQKSSIMEDRLIAEIEYFREKAAYYRMQKNLTSLQAKKVRYELEQMG